MKWELSPNADSIAKEFLHQPFSSELLDTSIPCKENNYKLLDVNEKDHYELFLSFATHYNEAASLYLFYIFDRNSDIKEISYLSSIVSLVKNHLKDIPELNKKHAGYPGGKNMIKATSDIIKSIENNIAELKKDFTNGDAIACAKEVDSIVENRLGFKMSDCLHTETNPYFKYIDDVEIEAVGENICCECSVM